jgi:predicted DNA binding CopG/RHH family protein
MALDKYERDLLKKFKRTEPSGKKRKELQEIARNTLAKDKRVNIRISSKDLRDIQLRAIEEGLPYQTLMASVLHKFVSGKFIEKEYNYSEERSTKRSRSR